MLFGLSILCGFISGMVGYSKFQTGGSFVGFFFLGMVLGLIGILITAAIKPSRPSTYAGWYDDPWREAALRWFDGWAWTAHTATTPNVTA